MTKEQELDEKILKAKKLTTELKLLGSQITKLRTELGRACVRCGATEGRFSKHNDDGVCFLCIRREQIEGVEKEITNALVGGIVTAIELEDTEIYRIKVVKAEKKYLLYVDYEKEGVCFKEVT